MNIQIPTPRQTPNLNTSTGELAKALAALQAEMPVIPKGQRANVQMKGGGTYSYTYASLHDVTRVIYPLLAKHGLSFTCAPEVRPDGTGTIGGVLLHVSGESVSSSLPLYGRTAQEIGSSLTYARRYLLGCLTGVVTDDDEDGSLANAAQQIETPMSDRTRRRMFKLFNEKGIVEADQLSGINYYTGGNYESRGDVSEADAQKVIARLESLQTPPRPSEAPPANEDTLAQENGPVNEPEGEPDPNEDVNR